MAKSVFSSSPYVVDGVNPPDPNPGIPAEECLGKVVSNEWVNAEYKHLVVKASPKQLKAKPGQLNYANSGTGANAHLAAELFKSMTGTSIEAIAYKSAAPALVDLIAVPVK
mgnify:CR=1 FL=1